MLLAKCGQKTCRAIVVQWGARLMEMSVVCPLLPDGGLGSGQSIGKTIRFTMANLCIAIAAKTEYHFNVNGLRLRGRRWAPESFGGPSAFDGLELPIMGIR